MKTLARIIHERRSLLWIGEANLCHLGCTEPSLRASEFKNKKKVNFHGRKENKVSAPSRKLVGFDCKVGVVLLCQTKIKFIFNIFSIRFISLFTVKAMNKLQVVCFLQVHYNKLWIRKLENSYS